MQGGRQVGQLHVYVKILILIQTQKGVLPIAPPYQSQSRKWPTKQDA